MTETQKAIRAQIKLGEIDLDVFQLPDGTYRMSATQVTATVNKSHKSIGEFLEGKSPQALPYKGSQLGKFKVEGVNKAVSEVTLDVASAYWMYWAFNGDANAQALSTACMAEALERRADAAFGIQRTEEERNERIKLRVQSKVTRRSYTDILKEKLIEQYGEEGYHAMSKQGYFRDVTVKVNLHLFGQPHFKCDRDNMTTEQLSDIELFERQLERRARRYPEHTAEQLMQWMIEQF